ncbi:pantetheine-phosphate adenylyltransferase [Photobacterium damselae]|uniref:pantetheine-phosphate adenylyltransferase n=1 Tax=Photobacterium damselae TaxID=38293 RepID=UPI00165DCAF4|nr:pantetheine-phosphate adenylyltransferase [Photobacterium damselae]MCG9705267.1 pantetheine-phosphate adenylyltransferase [Photobacterium damselae]
MTSRVIYPGTFDPMTKGHLDLIERASKLFDHVILAIANSPRKNTLFTLEERIELAQESCSQLNNVTILSFEGLIIDLLTQHQCPSLLRGIRTTQDFEYEYGLTSMYRRYLPDLEILFLTPKEKYAFVSSSMIKEIALHGGNVDEFVPPCVSQALEQKK